MIFKLRYCWQFEKNENLRKLPHIFVWSSNKLSFKESDVENRSVIVDKLEEVYFECESVIEASLSPVELFLCEPDGDELVDVVEHQYQDQVYWGSCRGDEDGVIFSEV